MNRSLNFIASSALISLLRDHENSVLNFCNILLSICMNFWNFEELGLGAGRKELSVSFPISQSKVP